MSVRDVWLVCQIGRPRFDLIGRAWRRLAQTGERPEPASVRREPTFEPSPEPDAGRREPSFSVEPAFELDPPVRAGGDGPAPQPSGKNVHLRRPVARDPEFDRATDAASQAMARRFAPPPAREEPSGPAGLGLFRRRWPQSGHEIGRDARGAGGRRQGAAERQPERKPVWPGSVPVTAEEDMAPPIAPARFLRPRRARRALRARCGAGAGAPQGLHDLPAAEPRHPLHAGGRPDRPHGAGGDRRCSRAGQSDHSRHARSHSHRVMRRPLRPSGHDPGLKLRIAPPIANRPQSCPNVATNEARSGSKSAPYGGRRARGMSMQARSWMRVAALLAMGAGLGGVATAQTAKGPATPEWSQTVTKEPAAAPGELDAKQLEIVQKLTAYFNEMGDMKGEFQQISPDGKRLRGKHLRQAAELLPLRVQPAEPPAHHLRRQVDDHPGPRPEDR